MKTPNYHISIMIISLAVVSVVFSQVVHAEVMSSGNYSIQSDSMNFGGGRSSSGSYNLEDTAGEVGTGDIQSTNSLIHAGYQQANASAAATSSTSTPSSTPSAQSPGSSSGCVLPMNVSSFTAASKDGSIYLGWQYPSGADIKSVRIVRSTSFFPTDISDGDVIFEGDTQSVIDHNVVVGMTYYYTIFGRNICGRYSSGMLAETRAVPSGEIVIVSTSTNPFANIPDAKNVHPAIADLTLSDFDFIQDGRNIIHAGKTIVIDGTKNLTIRLAYDKVPQVLKTIAISLRDPDDATKIFTFLLRVNADETAYEATIAPLGKSGNYHLYAIILDYKNQGLKRLEGQLRAVVFEGAGKLLENGGAQMVWLWILLLVILICSIFIFTKRNRRKVDLIERKDNASSNDDIKK